MLAPRTGRTVAGVIAIRAYPLGEHPGGEGSRQFLPTYVKPLDENTRAVIDALDTARTSHSVKPDSIQ